MTTRRKTWSRTVGATLAVGCLLGATTNVLGEEKRQILSVKKVGDVEKYTLLPSAELPMLWLSFSRMLKDQPRAFKTSSLVIETTAMIDSGESILPENRSAQFDEQRMLLLSSFARSMR